MGSLADHQHDFEERRVPPAQWEKVPEGVNEGVNEGVKPDMVNHPSHYTAGKIECIEALEEATKGLEGIEAVCTANAIKYLWRWKRKNGVEDLKKAIWYINRMIERNGESK